MHLMVKSVEISGEANSVCFSCYITFNIGMKPELLHYGNNVIFNWFSDMQTMITIKDHYPARDAATNNPCHLEKSLQI